MAPNHQAASGAAGTWGRLGGADGWGICSLSFQLLVPGPVRNAVCHIFQVVPVRDGRVKLEQPRAAQLSRTDLNLTSV